MFPGGSMTLGSGVFKAPKKNCLSLTYQFFSVFFLCHEVNEVKRKVVLKEILKVHYKHLHITNLNQHCLQESVAADQTNKMQTNQKLGFKNHSIIFEQHVVVDSVKIL